jgi:hypothetical protein
MIGVGLSLPVIAGRAGDPLPGLAQGGALFDPARDERWRQVSDGTVPAGAGDPVGWGQDLTAGKLLTQATTGNRPTRGRHPKTGVRNLLNGSDALATQSLTVAAVAHTLSFTGTGTVTLSGASTAGPLVGTGANDRVTLTFTPSAASLTLTVTGSVTLAQLELGSTATAYQRRVTINDVTEAGVPDTWFTVYDGTSDRLEGDAAMRDIFRNCEAGFFACVVEPIALGAVDIVGISVGDSATNVRFALRTLSNGTLEAQVRRADGGSASVIASASGVLEVNQKRIVMVVVDWVGGTVHLYASNPITPIATGAPPSGSGPSADTRSLAAAIGSRSDGSSRYFNGRLYGPIVMGRIAPSAAQRQAIFSRLSAITGAPLS